MRLFNTICAQFLFLFLLIANSFGQHSTGSEPAIIKVMEAPEVGHICTIEPTHKDDFFFIKPEEMASKEFNQAKNSNFQIDYFSEDGGPSWPNNAINAFNHAVEIWESHIESEIPIRVRANWVELEENTLGSAGPTQIISGFQGAESNTWYSIAQASAISGTDLGQQFDIDYDIVVNMNSSFNSWYFGTDANTPSGRIDFVTVVLHELGHGIGFTGSVRGDEDAETAEWGFGDDPDTPVNESDPIIYDRFVVDGNNTEITNTLIYPNPSSQLYDAVTGQNGGLFFVGDEAGTVYGGLPVPLYAPEPWDTGSSYSHLDQQTFSNTENALMRPQIGNALAIHTPGPVMCGILADKGWPMGGSCLALLGAESIIVLSEEEFDFGVTNSGTGVEQFITVTNDENAVDPLVGRVEISDGNSFTVQNGVQNLNLDPGESINIRLTYNPNSAGMDSGEIEVTHNASNRPRPIRIALTGEALEAEQVVQLDPNFPNPFNATTNIPYAIPQTSNVRIDIFNVLGQHMQTLVNSEQSSGRYVQELQADDFSSGMYIYRIIVDGAVESGKLLLVK